MAATEPVKCKKQVRELADYWLKRGNKRNYLLIVFGVCTALRISDLLLLKWADVYNEATGTYYPHISVIEKKTNKTKKIALNHQAINALKAYFPQRRGKYIFSNNRKNENALCRVQAWRIIREASKAIGITGATGGHVLRKTFGFFAWQSGVLPVLLMDLFNHSSFEITRRYLGISQTDRDKVYLSLTLF